MGIDTSGASLTYSSDLDLPSGVSLTKLGPRTLSLRSGSYDNINIDAGTVRFITADALPSGTNSIHINSGGAVEAEDVYSTVMGWLDSGEIDPNSTGTLALVADSNENINMSGYSGMSLGALGYATYTYSGTLTPDDSVYRLGGGSGILTVSSAITDNGSAKGLAVSGPGTVILTSTGNTYSGTTSVDTGTLQIGSGGSGVSLSSQTVNLTNGGTLVFDHSDTEAYAGTISGTGNLIQDGGRLVLSVTGTNVNNYSGTTTVSAGTLQVGTANALPSGTNLTVASGAVLDLNGYDQTVNSYTGNTYVNGGTLQIGNGGSDDGLSLNSGVTLSNNATLAFDLGGVLGYAQYITGHGRVTMNGTGTLELEMDSDANSYDGGTTINGGTVQDTAGDNMLPTVGTLTVNGPTNSIDPSGIAARGDRGGAAPASAGGIMTVPGSGNHHHLLPSRWPIAPTFAQMLPVGGAKWALKWPRRCAKTVAKTLHRP